MTLNYRGLGAGLPGGVLVASVFVVAGAALLASGPWTLPSVIQPPGAALPVLSSPVSATWIQRDRIAAAYGHLPLVFEANQGQSDPQVKFLAHGKGYGLFLTEREAVLVMQHSARGARQSAQAASVLRMGLAGAQPSPQVAGLEFLPGKSNYLIGNDPAKWQRNVPQFARVRYHEVYPGIDLVYYGKQGRLEYDFEVAPGADPRQIALRLQASDDERPERPKFESNGDLRLVSADGDVRWQAPHVYQKFGNEQRAVGGKFVLRQDGTVGFDLDTYDRSRALIIDPVLTYSTYLGGAGAESCSAITGQAFTPGCPAITVDSALSAYVVGSTNSPTFPAPGTAPVLKGVANVFVTKFDSAGSALLFSTYIGGTGTDTTAGIAVDSGFKVYVAGTTTSTDFPTIGGFQLAPKAAGTHVFITELDSSGSNPLYSTYLSGSGTDLASGLAIDNQAKLYLTGTTTSVDFPVTGGAFQTIAGCPPGGGTCSTPPGITQFFISKVDPALTGNGSLPYSTYFGGSNPANGVAIGGGIAVDSSNNVYITGGTSFLHVGAASTDFPILNAVQGCLDLPQATAPTTAVTCSGSAMATDAFVAKLNISPNVASGAQLQYSTYIGGTGSDVGYSIAVDTGGAAYITGSTTSGDFVLPTATVPFLAANSGGTDAFVAKVSSFTPPATTSTTATAVSLLYFSYLGGVGNDVGTAIAVDAASEARVTGWTDSTTGTGNFPTQSLIESTPGGGRDAFVVNLNTVGTTACVPNPGGTPPVFCPSYSTFLGGNGTDMGTDIALDSQGGTYVTGETASASGFPLQAALQGGLSGPSDAFVTKLGPIVNLGIAATASPTPVGVGGPVTFTYTITNLGDFVTGVTFTDNVPGTGATATFTSATASPGSCGGAVTGGTLQCNIGNLNTTASGATGATVTVVLTPSAPTTPSPTAQSLGNSGQVGLVGSNFQKTASAAAVVNDFSLGVAPASATVVAGAPASYQITVTPTGGIPGAVALAVGSGLPTGASAAFSTTPIPNLSNGPVSSVLVVNTTARVTTTVQRWRRGGPFYAIWLPVSGLALLGVGMDRKRRLLAGFMLTAFFTLLILQAGCGTKKATTTTTGTPAGTYTLTVNATSGSATRTTTVQLVVQ